MNQKKKVTKFHAKHYANGIASVFNQHKTTGKISLCKFIVSPRYLSYGIRLQNSTDFDTAKKLGEKIALHCSATSVRLERSGGIIYYQISIPPSLWDTIYTANLKPGYIGINTTGRQVPFDFEEPHTLVAGATGSGKTEALNTIIYSLAKCYRPDQLKFMLFDPHHELEQFDYLSHLIMPIARTKEAIEKGLNYVANEAHRRINNNIRNDFKLIVLADEAWKVIQYDYLDVLQSLGQETRKFGINAIIASQQTKQDYLGDLPKNIANKFIGYVTNAHESAYITGHAGMQANKLTGKGDFLHISPKTDERFQVALTRQHEIDSLERTSEIIEPEIEPVSEVLIKTPNHRPTEVQLLPEAVPHYIYSQNSLTGRQAKDMFSGLLDKLFSDGRSFGRNWHDHHKEQVGKMLIEMNRNGYKMIKEGGK